MAGLTSLGSRKYTLGFVACIIYGSMVTFLGMLGIEAGADPTSLGVMFGGIAAGFTGIMGTFVWGNAKEWEAKSNGLDTHLRIS